MNVDIRIAGGRLARGLALISAQEAIVASFRSKGMNGATTKAEDLLALLRNCQRAHQAHYDQLVKCIQRDAELIERAVKQAPDHKLREARSFPENTTNLD